MTKQPVTTALLSVARRAMSDQAATMSNSVGSVRNQVFCLLEFLILKFVAVLAFSFVCYKEIERYEMNIFASVVDSCH